MAQAAAIFDLDRTLIAGSSAPIFANAMADAGITEARDIPFADLFMRVYENFGESRLMMAPARIAHRASKGWPVDDVRTAARSASVDVADRLQPFAEEVFAEHRAAGRLLVLATTSPEAFVRPLAEELDFDDVICTKWRSEGGEYTGELDGPFVWGPEKADAVEAWAKANNVKTLPQLRLQRLVLRLAAARPGR